MLNEKCPFCGRKTLAPHGDKMVCTSCEIKFDPETNQRAASATKTKRFDGHERYTVNVNGAEQTKKVPYAAPAARTDVEELYLDENRLMFYQHYFRDEYQENTDRGNQELKDRGYHHNGAIDIDGRYVQVYSPDENADPDELYAVWKDQLTGVDS